MIVTAVVVWQSIYSRLNTALVNEANSSVDYEAELKASRLSAGIDRLRHDVASLSSDPTVLAMAAGGEDVQSEAAELARRWEGVLKARPTYAQIRYIDRTGHERVRVDRRGASVSAVAQADLQDKSDTQYFQATMLLAPGDIYMSDVTLNREHGLISEPVTPMLRGAAPITHDGSIAGMVVVNMSMQSQFSALRDLGDRAFRTYVVDVRGDFLLHDDDAKAFAFEFGAPYRIEEEFGSAAWKALANDRSDVVTTGGGDDTIVLGSSAITPDPRRPEQKLWIVLAVPESHVVAAATSARNQVIPIGLALVALALGCGALIARTVVKPLGGEPTVIESIAARVAEGDLEIDFVGSLDSKSGILGALRRMVADLRSSRHTSELQYWLTTEVGRLAALGQSFENADDLARAMASELATLVGAGHAAFYVQSDQPQPEYFLRGAYALDEQRTSPGPISLGQGLIGQCAVEQVAILLTDVPADYARIGSGVGAGLPLDILVTPIAFLGEVLAVVELASFHHYENHERELVERVALNLGVVLNGLRQRRRTELLLEQSRHLTEELQTQSEALQSQSEELQAQSEELRTTNEELEEKTDALGRQRDELRQKNDALERAREELEARAQEAGRASNYKSEFLANMSHELRTPLNSLLILSQALAENRDGRLSPDDVESAEVIRSCGHDLLQLIDDILDLSKVEAGKLVIKSETVSITRVLDRLSRQFEPLAAKKCLEFRVERTADTPDTIVGDSQRIEQILKNLLSNAVKFTELGHVVLGVSATDAPVGASGDELEPWIRFTVEDTGIGIPASRCQAVWEAFQQADGSTSRKYGGTGLGLAITRELTQLLGGRATVASVEGEGSTFELHLPTRSALANASGQATASVPLFAESNRAASASTVPSTKERLLLVVEDDERFAQILADLGRRQGFRCVVRSTVAAAIEAAKSLQPTALLLDLGLPDGDGTDVLDALRADATTRAIPVHVVSAHDRKGDAMSHGAIGFLAKPADAEALVRVLRELARLPVDAPSRVLVVDSDDEARASIVAALTEGGMQVIEAANGRNAVDLLAARHVDCVVLEPELADMDWHQFHELMKEAVDGRAPAIIVHTERVPTAGERAALSDVSRGIVLKGAASPDRVLDEVVLFLRSVEIEGPAARPVQSTLAAHDESFLGRRVLLVDDDLRNSFALKRVLQGVGFVVVVADNGELALERLLNEPSFDIVLMDIMMPIMDGYTTMKHIRKMEGFAQLPILALTAKAMPEDRGKCIAAGANDYLSKPIDFDKLFSAMRLWIAPLDREVA